MVDIIREVCSIRGLGNAEEKAALDNEIETAYLEKKLNVCMTVWPKQEEIRPLSAINCHA